jgi:hypothetical protein
MEPVLERRQALKDRSKDKKNNLNSGPLYINSTSIGPRGHLYPSEPKQGSKNNSKYISSGYTYLEIINSGAIHKVSFRSL